jgi:hypothetical protein
MKGTSNANSKRGPVVASTIRPSDGDGCLRQDTGKPATYRVAAVIREAPGAATNQVIRNQVYGNGGRTRILGELVRHTRHEWLWGARSQHSAGRVIQRHERRGFWNVDSKYKVVDIDARNLAL